MSELNYPLEISAPDISSYRKGNAGVDYVHTFDSKTAGPHVMVSAVVHGNELCGAIALDFLLQNDVRPVNGKLTLAFMNVAAYLRFDPADPGASRFVDEDFNRLWSEEVL
ncbi:MAG: succinylglutamate desuccinylase/aspartoacylase family protein, partial [Gammaproteobacteria bacterium]|nr:succinylglutamate desuccinylase/aspartoacylase family protein [Gammaproteobacteria bacterium]